MKNEKAQHTPGPLECVTEALRLAKCSMFKSPAPDDAGDIELRQAALLALETAEYLLRVTGPIHNMLTTLILIAERSPKMSQASIEARAAIARAEGK